MYGRSTVGFLSQVGVNQIGDSLEPLSKWSPRVKVPQDPFPIFSLMLLILIEGLHQVFSMVLINNYKDWAYLARMTIGGSKRLECIGESIKQLEKEDPKYSDWVSES